MRVFCKHHGLNYFGLGYWKDIACAHNYSMHMQYLKYYNGIWIPTFKLHAFIAFKLHNFVYDVENDFKL